MIRTNDKKMLELIVGGRRVVAGLLGLLLLAGPVFAMLLAEKDRETKSPSGEQSSSLDSEYRVGPGDVIEITVWKEPEVSAPTVVIRPDGKISLPLINDLLINGKTPMEIQALLTEKLAPFINSPNVTVTVKEIRSKRVYVLGQVMKPGVYEIRQPLTVLQMLTEAGGPQPFAKLKAMYVLRTEGGEQKKLPFNYKQVVKGQNIVQNILLQPGDTIVVP